MVEVEGSTGRQYGCKSHHFPDYHRIRYKFAASKVSGVVLDAACGSGWGTSMLATNATRTIGVDISDSAIRYARENFIKPCYIVGDLYTRPWKGRFDWIVSIETLEHLDDPLKVLKFFKEDGKNLIATVPNEDVYPFKEEHFHGDEYPHKKHYTPKDFDALLEAAGYKVKNRYSQRKNLNRIEKNLLGQFLIYVCE